MIVALALFSPSEPKPPRLKGAEGSEGPDPRSICLRLWIDDPCCTIADKHSLLQMQISG